MNAMTFEGLASARRVLSVCNRIQTLPALPADDWEALQKTRAIAVEYIGLAITELIRVLDVVSGDPDCDEDDTEDAFAFSAHGEACATDAAGPGCFLTEQDAGAWVEWTSMRAVGKRGPNSTFGPEDAEDDEGGGDDAQSEDEPGFEQSHRRWANSRSHGAGCTISDSDFGVDDVGEPNSDDEIEQMGNDVPCLPVFAIEPNIFTGERQLLGMSNLKPSFVCSGPRPEEA